MIFVPRNISTRSVLLILGFFMCVCVGKDYSCCAFFSQHTLDLPSLAHYPVVMILFVLTLNRAQH